MRRMLYALFFLLVLSCVQAYEGGYLLDIYLTSDEGGLVQSIDEVYAQPYTDPTLWGYLDSEEDLPGVSELDVFRVLDETGEVLHEEGVLLDFHMQVFVANHNDVASIKVLRNGEQVASKKISFCDDDGMCEPCLDAACELSESASSCGDCGSGGADGFCDMLSDGVCDPDCEDVDADCDGCVMCTFTGLTEADCAVLGGESCGFTEVCLGGKKISSDDEVALCCIGGSCGVPSAFGDALYGAESLLLVQTNLDVQLDIDEEPPGTVPELFHIEVIDKNDYYLHRFLEGDFDFSTDYKLQTVNEAGSVVSEVDMLFYETAVSYREDIVGVRVVKGSDIVLEKDLEFCNSNGICEYCESGVCALLETGLTCEDCTASGTDGLCNIANDNVCDPDCPTGFDCEDCGTKCADIGIPEDIELPEEFLEYSDGAEYIPEEVPEVPVKEEVLTSPGYAPVSESTSTLIIGTGVGLLILLIIIALLSTRKTKGEVRVQNLQQEIHGLVGRGYNYVQIKQYLVQKGHHPQHVDGAIRKHYDERVAPKQLPIAPILTVFGIIFLVSLFFFLPQTITGLQIAETDTEETPTIDAEETKMVLGINPSFHISVDYDIAFYTTVADNVKTLEECQADIDCMLEKVAAFDSDEVNWIVELNGAILTNQSDGTPESDLWVTHCESIEEFAGNTFTENLEFCATSVIDGCICNVSIPSETTDYPPYSDSLWKDFELELNNQQVTPAGFEQSQEDTSSIGALLYVDDGDAELADIELADGYTFRYETFSEASSLVFYRENANKVILIEPDALPRYEGAKPCEKLRITPRFCIINKNNVLPIYDFEKEGIEDAPLVVKFAYTFEKKLTNVRGVNLTDLALAEDAVVISWDALPPEQVQSYTVYYGTEDFEGLLVKDLTEDEELSQQIGVEINTTGPLIITEAMKFRSIDTGPECILDDNQVCVPTYTVTEFVSEEEVEVYGVRPESTTAELSDGILYYISLDDRYFTILPVPDITSSGDTQEWYFGVIAEDPEGETTEGFGVPEVKVEETALITRIGTGTGKSFDDLPPGIPQFSVINTTFDGGTATFTIINVTTNIDGSPSDDLGEYVFYCGQGYLESGDTLYPLESAWLSSLPISDITTTQFEHNISMAIITSAPECGTDLELHRFIVIASDKRFASDIPAFSKANSYNGSVTAKGYSN